MKIKIATSQFSVSSNIQNNKDNIITQINEAKGSGAHLIHFPEGSLSGYAGIDFDSFEGYNWQELTDSTYEIIKEARNRNIWLILGSAHRLENHKPHNCLYIIDNNGQIADRYDKMFCAGNEEENTEDLLHFSPGDHFTTFDVSGIKCGVLICHEYRYPELYREYKKRGVEIMFHSFHAGNMNPTRQASMEAEVGEEFFEFNNGRTIPCEIDASFGKLPFSSNP